MAAMEVLKVNEAVDSVAVPSCTAEIASGTDVPDAAATVRVAAAFVPVIVALVADPVALADGVSAGAAPVG